MVVNITARHWTIPEALRRRTEERMNRLLRFDERLVSVDVSFEADHGVHRAEARLVLPRGGVMVAHGSGASYRAALDRAADRLTRQLKRRNERKRTHHAARVSEEGIEVPGSA